MWLQLTIILTLSGSPSPVFTDHVEDELNRLFHAARVRVEVKESKAVNDLGTADEVLYVRVNGPCRPARHREPGRLAAVEFLDGDAQPFITVDCTRIVTSISPNPRLAVAMGRVLAHETLHYLLNDNGHGDDCDTKSLFCPGMTSRALTEPLVALSKRDLERLREYVVETRRAAADAAVPLATH